MSIYHWKLGDIALARICKKVYAKVKIVKNENGLFYDDKVLGLTTNADGEIEAEEELCYYVEISRSGKKLWLPYKSLHLASRSRPFYGVDKVSPSKSSDPPSSPGTPKKRKSKEEHPLPLQVKVPNTKDPDLNTTYDNRHAPLKQSKYENAFQDFVRRGKELIFDEFYSNFNAEANIEALGYLSNLNTSTEEKFEAVMKNKATLKEVENYLHQCWRYNFLNKHSSGDSSSSEGSDDSASAPSSPSPVKFPVTVHMPFCLVCGQGNKLLHCKTCPASHHAGCRRDWLITVIHRKKPPQKNLSVTTFVEKILSSTRAITTSQKEEDDPDLCPSCMWGPRVGYEDVVWHKLRGCPWWPARVVSPGAAPPRLLAAAHAHTHWPLRYYGTLNYAWGDTSRMCLFLPRHAGALAAREPGLQQAVFDACDDYITVYLT